jgi:peptidylprolyl isomerase
MGNIEKGKTVQVHYRGTFDDGVEFDTSRTREEPLSFCTGAGQVISGFDTAVSEMEVGETKTIRLEPEDAYGEYNSDAKQEVPKASFPADFEFKAGATVYGQNQLGQQMVAKIENVGEENVELNFNHPLAGKALTFELELINVE